MIISNEQKIRHETILIVDFGSQLTQLIARRLREIGVYCEIHPFMKAGNILKKLNPKGIIFSGGPASILDENAPQIDENLLKANIPILAICYGQQALCKALGGQVEAGHDREFGRAYIIPKKKCALYEDIWKIGEKYQVWMSHGDRVTKLPKNFVVIAASNGAPFAFIENREKQIWAVQFHPEVHHTPDGKKLLSNFALKICGCSGDWTMAAYRQQSIDKIRAQVGDKKVICALSGGVDSSVAAVLVHEAIGDNLTCILVDHGLMRENEAENIIKMFNKHHNLPLILVDAKNLFINALKGIIDPEKKRKIIGHLFIEVFEREAKKLGGADFLAQGTLYPDVIESVSFSGGPSVTIKSHHNVGGLPEKMHMQLIEPLRELFKDEVRKLGKELGLPDNFISRHPFPGPGLAIRLPGGVTQQKLDILRKADAIYLEEIKRAGLYDKIWQAFAVLLPVQTVGVMGDNRTYEFVCALRAVTSVDGMTADFYPYKMDFLAHAATRIINEVRGINRVVYDITSKPPGTIEWE